MSLIGLLSACGYRPLYAGDPPAEKLSLVAGPSLVAEVDVVHAALAGARAELNRSGVLRAGAGYPKVVLQVLRVDERTTGIVVVPQPGEDLPLGRGSSIGVSGRAWVIDAPRARPSRDSGDVRRVVQVAAGAEPTSDAAAYDQAARAAGRALGRDLARYILGEPVPAIEPL